MYIYQYIYMYVVIYSPNGKHLASASADKTFRVPMHRETYLLTTYWFESTSSSNDLVHRLRAMRV